MARNSQGTVDPLDFTSVLERQGSTGVKLTFMVPTDVTGKSDTLSMLTLKNQLREARQALHGTDSHADSQTGSQTGSHADVHVDAILEPVEALLEDSSYWRLQSRGLVIFAADGFFMPVRMPIEVTESLSVGERFDLLPLAPVLASDRKLYVLALAKNQVRLFDSSRNVIEELPLDGIPASFDEVIDELPERDLDVRAGSAGAAGTPSFHGPDGDIDRALSEKFIHAVGQAVGARLGTARSQLLVLASVAEYLPMFTRACPYPAIFDGVIAGNPERSLPDDLRSAAWQLVNAHEAKREAAEHDHARSLVHAGKGAFDLAEIARAADEGRVDTLFLPRDVGTITDDDERELANRALFGTLKNGGTLRTLGETEGSGLATFRY